MTKKKRKEQTREPNKRKQQYKIIKRKIKMKQPKTRNNTR
jgi:hypothetical protein